VASIVENCKELCRPEAQGLFEVLSNVRAVGITDDVFCAEVDESTKSLATCLGLPSIGALYGICAASRVQQLLAWADVDHLRPCDVPWTKDSQEVSQLETVILMADAPSLVSHLGLLVRAVAACSDKEQHEPELRLRMVKMLAALSTEDAISANLTEHYDKLLHSIIMPCGKWFAGRMIERLREAAMAMLCLMMQHRIGTDDDFEESEAEILETIRNNIDDDWVAELRRVSTQTLGAYILRRGEANRLDGASAREMATDLLKRLDDKLDDVRLEAQQALRILFEAIPDDFADEDWAKTTSTLMIHLDDPNAQIRQGVQAVLLAAARKRPQYVMNMCEEARGLHQTSVHCDTLIASCKLHMQ